jgi:hypothetical protein
VFKPNTGFEPGINVVDPIRRKGYRFKGSATVLREGDLFDDVVRFFERERGTDHGRINAVVMVEVEQAASLMSPAYDDGSTEADIAQRSLTMYRLRRIP